MLMCVCVYDRIYACAGIWGEVNFLGFSFFACMNLPSDHIEFCPVSNKALTDMLFSFENL